MQTEGMDACFLFERPSLQTMPLENRPNNSELYHIVMEMKIRESSLQTGTFIYKPGISVTKQDFHLQMGSLGLQMGFSAYYLPKHNNLFHITLYIYYFLYYILYILFDISYNTYRKEAI